MRTAVWAAASGAAFIFLLAAAEWIARSGRLSPESSRKVAHLSCGLLAAALPVVLPFSAIVVIAAAFIPFMLVSRRAGLFPVVHSAERQTYGEIYFPVGVLLAAALVPHVVEYAFGVLVLAMADAVAGVLGSRFGRRSYRLLRTNKTYLGSGAFFGTTVVLGLGAAGVLGELSATEILIVLGVAAILTAEEAAVGGGADNIILPVSAAAMLRAFL